MVVDEAHFIKNKSSQRSQNVLEIAQRIRSRTGNPLLMALTGTPLINDLDDFLPIWEFLGWIDATKPIGNLMRALEATGLVPADPGFYAAARRCVIDQGIVRRRKIDVAADIPARRVADLPVELDGAAGRSIRRAQEELADALVARYDAAIKRQAVAKRVEGIDHDVVRRVAAWARKQESAAGTTDNVFTMMRKIGQAKAELAADYTAQLAGNVGKVVFFAKHIDVMDAAEDLFTARGLQHCSIRGNQTRKAREAAIAAFANDPEMAVAVCSLSAAGVGLNLQAASNLVLAELPWTEAEQRQAIDRIHRIGQEQPVTAWRILASGTIDTRVAELIDQKAGLAARALDGSTEEAGSSEDVAQEALAGLLVDALEARSAAS
jgi:SNF2 family DNA or RNA helicase